MWQAIRVWGSCGPAVLQVQNDIWVRPLQETHFYKNWFPQHFGDWVICCSVEGAVCHHICNKRLQLSGQETRPQTSLHHSHLPHIPSCDIVLCRVGAQLSGVLQLRQTVGEEQGLPPTPEPPQLCQNIYTGTAACWNRTMFRHPERDLKPLQSIKAANMRVLKAQWGSTHSVL